MSDAEILKPAFALAGLTFLVWLRLYWVRIAQMRRDRIDAQRVASSAQSAALLTDTRAADNFRKMFELPVLFYAAVCIAAIMHVVTPVSLGLAWAFVALRMLHSLVHCSYNRVMHRFGIYITGALVLFALWAYLAVQLW